MSDAAIPAISVVMSVHNAEKYLQLCVDSVLGQDFADFEFIIVDDASSDSSSEMLQSYAGRDKRVHVLCHQVQSGLTASLNQAIKRSRGKFIARMDADDICHPNRLSLQAAFLSANPKISIVGSEVMLIDEQGWKIGPRGHPQTHDQIERRLWLGDGGALTHPATMMRRESLMSVGGYDERFDIAQDLDLYLRLAEVGQLANLPDILLCWRQHRESVNQKKHHKWQETKRLALTEAARRRGANVDLEEFDRIHHDFVFGDFNVRCSEAAVARGHLITAWKHFLAAIWNVSLSKRNLYLGWVLVRQTIKRACKLAGARGLFSRR